MEIRFKHIILYLITTILISSCVEPFTAGTENFEDLLVIKATLTNEFKFQEIGLNRTYKLEEDGAFSYEIGAHVVVKDDAQNTYNFLELYPGKYRSVSKFKIEIGKKYQLFITTANGKKYTSTQEEIFSEKDLGNVYAEKTIDNAGKEGISVYVDSYDPTGKSKYYRFDYIEAYKVLAPNAGAFDFSYNNSTPPFLELFPRREEKRVCYKIVPSKVIQQKNTLNLSEDRIDRFSVLFIKERDYKTTYRYSILVKQYIQTLNAYTFYKTLHKFSGSETVFSQVQAGVIVGNILANDIPEEKTLGFFEVASVSFQRIYFKHHDFFPNNIYPRYFRICHQMAPLGDISSLITSGEWVFYRFNNTEPYVWAGGPYVLTDTECGDCTSFASNIKPDYWID